MSHDNGQLDTDHLDLRALLISTPVGKLTLTRVPALAPDQSLNEAADEMRSVSHGSALICEDGRLVGIITERDLLRLLSEDADFDAPVAQFMTSTPRTLSTDDHLLDAMQLMDGGGHRRVPVVDESGCPVGLIDVKTVMHYFVELVPATIYNQAATSLLTVRSAEGA